MTTFQLDQCLNNKEIAAECNAEGDCVVWRYPRALKDSSDAGMLGELFPRGNPILTTDHSIHFDSPESFSRKHPGVIIIRNAPQIAGSINPAHIRRIFRGFKQRFPLWKETSWSNSIMQISQIDVAVWHVENLQAVADLHVSFDEGGWQEKLAKTLAKNAVDR